MQQKTVLKQPTHFKIIKCVFLLAFLLMSSHSLWSQGFVQQTGANNPFNNIKVPLVAAPTFGDLDGDGDQDLLIGATNSRSNKTVYFKNTGTATAPVFTQVNSPIPDFSGPDQYITPDLADVDGDGDLDAVIGNSDGVVLYFENTGTPFNPVFVQRTGAANPFDGIQLSGYTAPTLGDLDGDGDLDIIVSNDLSFNEKVYYKNIGTSTAPVYVQQTGSANPLNNLGNLGKPALGDIDKDGDLDIVVGTLNGNFLLYLNIGTPTNPVFVDRSDILSSFYFHFDSYDRDDSDLPFPGLADLDGDGDLDMAVGLFLGSVAYLENVLQITKQPTPAGSTVCLGSSVSTSIQARGDSTLSYQWYRNNRSTATPVPGQTSAKLSLTNVQPDDAGLYYALVTGAGVSVWSEPFSLTVSVTQITTQPQNTFACVGSTATFTVGATGSNLIYKWYRNGQAARSSSNQATLTLNNVRPADSGSYTVDVIGDCGKVTSNAATLIVNLTQITTQPQNTPACKGSTATFTVAASGNNLIYKWYKDGQSARSSNNSPTLTIANAQPSDAGSYTVDVIGDCGTVTSNAATLTVNSASTPIVTVANNCGSSTLSTTATGSLLWSTNETSSSINVSNAGTYTVTQTVNGCTSAAGSGTAAPKTVPSAPVVTVANYCGSSILSTTATGALLWSTNETTASITVRDVGSYNVKQTVNGCTSAAGSGTANPYSSPSASITSQANVDCNGNSTGSVTVTGSGGTSPYSYSTNGTDFTNTSGTFSSLAAGNYTITVKDAHGCSTTIPLNITQPDQLAVRFISQTNITCNGGTSQVTISAIGGTGTLSYTFDGVTNTTGVFTHGAGSNLAFSVTDANNCRAITGTIDIAQPAAITVIPNHTDAGCNGATNATATLTASGGTAPYSYTLGNTTNATGTFSGLAAGNYNYRVTDARSCTAATGSVIIGQPAVIPAPSVTVSDNCGSSTLSTTATGTLLWSTGETTASITVSNAGNYTVTQTLKGCTSALGSGTAAPKAIPSTPVVTVTNNCGSSILSTTATGTLLWSTGATTSTITVSNAGSYTVTQTINGCTSDAGSGTAAPKVIPSTPSVTVTNNCGSSILSTTATGTLLWSTGETTSSITVSNAGNYTVTQTVNGCTSAAGSGTGTPNAIPSAPVVTVANNCGSATLSTTATGTLLWSTGEATPSITVSNAGSYTVTQTVNGCTSAAGSGTGTPNAIPSAPVVTVANNCGSATLSTTATGTLLWSTGEATPSITVSNAGSYTVTQTVNGCTSAAGSGTAAPNAIPSTPVVNVANNCGSSILSTTATGTLLWSTGATTASITVSTPANYTVMQTVNGCTSAAGSGTAAPKAIPSTPVVNVANNCGSSILSTTATGTLLWSTGATTASITVSNAGTYTVTQTVNGCTSSSGSGNAAPKAAVSKPVVTANGPANFCQGGNVVLSAPSGFASYKWSNNATTQTITVNQSGSYTVVVTNAAGCNSPASDAITVTVTVDTQKPVITCPAAVVLCYDATENYTIAPLQATDNCGIASITCTISGATTRSGSGANASGKFSSGTSTITWTVKDGSGNTSTCQSNVTINEKFTAFIPDGWALGSGCTLNTVYIGYTPASYILLIATPYGGKSPYTYKWSNGSTASFILVNPAAATTYTVTVKDSKGCTQSASKQISVVDVRCGSKMDKVTLCYKGTSMCIDQKDVANYLLKGAYLGNCKNATSKSANEIVQKEVKEESDFTVKASPNPSTAFFKLTINSSNVKDKVTISVVDEVGRAVETKTASAGETIQIGDRYRAGMYFAQAIQGNKRVTIKLVKQAW